MADRKVSVATDQAPAALGPYSQAVLVGDAFYCSGQVGLNPSTGELAGDSFEEQALQVFSNLRAVLAEANMTFANVVKVTVYLLDIDDFPILNEMYAGYFSEPYPARATVEVTSLPKNALVEIDLIASEIGAS